VTLVAGICDDSLINGDLLDLGGVGQVAVQQNGDRGAHRRHASDGNHASSTRNANRTSSATYGHVEDYCSVNDDSADFADLNGAACQRSHRPNLRDAQVFDGPAFWQVNGGSLDCAAQAVNQRVLACQDGARLQSHGQKTDIDCTANAIKGVCV